MKNSITIHILTITNTKEKRRSVHNDRNKSLLFISEITKRGPSGEREYDPQKVREERRPEGV